MFKQRLKELGLNIMIVISLLLGLGVLAAMIFFITEKFTMTKQQADLIIGTLCVIIVISLVIKIGKSVWHFINWLFIEPYKHRKKDEVK